MGDATIKPGDAKTNKEHFQDKVFKLIAEKEQLKGKDGKPTFAMVIMPQMILDFCGDKETALLLSNLIYWSDRGIRQDEFVWKSASEWNKETGLSKYEVSNATLRLYLAGIIDVENRRAVSYSAKNEVRSSPTNHFRLNRDALMQALERFMEDSQSKLLPLKILLSQSKNIDCGSKNLTYRKSNNLLSLTETTAKNKQRPTKATPGKDFSGNTGFPLSHAGKSSQEGFRENFSHGSGRVSPPARLQPADSRRFIKVWQDEMKKLKCSISVSAEARKRLPTLIKKLRENKVDDCAFGQWCARNWPDIRREIKYDKGGKSKIKSLNPSLEEVEYLWSDILTLYLNHWEKGRQERERERKIAEVSERCKIRLAARQKMEAEQEKKRVEKFKEKFGTPVEMEVVPNQGPVNLDKL